jgi:hypothetical protein
MEIDLVSETLCSLFIYFLEYRTMDKAQNPVILIVMNDLWNPSGSPGIWEIRLAGLRKIAKTFMLGAVPDKIRNGHLSNTSQVLPLQRIFSTKYHKYNYKHCEKCVTLFNCMKFWSRFQKFGVYASIVGNCKKKKETVFTEFNIWL